MKRLAGALLALALLAAPLAHAADSASSLIQAAGNAQDDAVRLAHLRTLSARAETLLDAPTRAELAALLPVVEAWAEGRTLAAREIAKGKGQTHRYLHRFFDDATGLFDPPFPAAPRVDSPLYPLWCFYRGRFVAWYMIQHSEVLAVPEKKKLFTAESERDFGMARRAFPQNVILKIYGGENVPAPDLSPWDDRAPAWANHQRRALEQVHRIIRWWIAKRQLASGEFGGGWGDDGEMWRWWAAVAIGFDDPAVIAAEERLARGNLSRPSLAAGYTDQLTDVEHAAEETGDSLTPMLHAVGPTPEWTRRVRRLLELADAVWWGENQRGRLQFKHIDFNYERLGPDPGRAYDTGYHSRVLQPVLLLWQRTKDPALGRPLTRWLRTWAEAAMSTDNGKPAGIVPAALQWPSGLVGSVERGWIGPQLAGDPMIGLYSWPGRPVAAMTAALLQAYVQTREPIFREPLVKMAELRRAHLAAGNRDGTIGDAAWAAHRLPEVINGPLAKIRQLTGDSRLDDLFLADASGYVRYVIAGDEPALTQALAATARTLSVNWPMYTSEVRYTDRVLSFPHAWPRAVTTGLPPIDYTLLYSTVTGDPGSVSYAPVNGARWHTRPREIAALVAENRRDRFAAELFHFGAGKRPLAVSLLMLDPGNYRWTLRARGGRELARGEFRLAPDRRRLSLNLPSRVQCRLDVSPAP
jgi:hypothetical protein